MKLRLQPFRVLCFHQVSDRFDEKTMYAQDWISTSDFQNIVHRFQAEGYRFISLPEAHDKLANDKFRKNKYVVLTADDGWASLKNILPWLNEQGIPVTLFLNPAFFDGKHYRIQEGEKYLSAEEVQNLHKQYPLLTIGSHGWEHVDASRQNIEEFRDSVIRSAKYLSKLPNYIPFFAYTWGRCTEQTNQLLNEMGITPLVIKGGVNYNDSRIIDREIFDTDITI